MKMLKKIFKEKGDKESELEIIKSTTINQMWTCELDRLREEYINYKEERQRQMTGEETKKKKVISKGTVIKKTTKKLVIDDA